MTEADVRRSIAAAPPWPGDPRARQLDLIRGLLSSVDEAVAVLNEMSDGGGRRPWPPGVFLPEADVRVLGEALDALLDLWEDPAMAQGGKAMAEVRRLRGLLPV